MIEQPAFGQRVRQIRRQHGLSQVQLAGEEMSASYISLVESGHRIPSLELAKVIADRLGVSLGELTAPDEAPSRQTRRLGLVGRLIAANTARAGGDLEAARNQVKELLAELTGPENDDLAWEARWTLAGISDELGEYEKHESVLRELRGHPFTLGSAQLQARVVGALAELARRRGRLDDSIALAEEGIRAAATLGAGSTERVRLDLTLLLSLAVMGERRQAGPLADELLALLPDVHSRSQRGVIAWAIAGFRLLGNATAGTQDLIDRAFAELTPSVDLARWAALSRAAAAMRLHLAAAGPAADGSTGRAAIEPEVERLLGQARQVLELIGQPADRVMLAGVEALAHLCRTDIAAARSTVAGFEPDIPLTAALHQPGLLLIAARVHAAADERGLAAAAYRAAATRYEEAGAYRPAAEIWRELSGFVETGAPAAPAAAGWGAIMLP